MELSRLIIFIEVLLGQYTTNSRDNNSKIMFKVPLVYVGPALIRGQEPKPLETYCDEETNNDTKHWSF